MPRAISVNKKYLPSLSNMASSSSSHFFGGGCRKPLGGGPMGVAYALLAIMTCCTAAAVLGRAARVGEGEEPAALVAALASWRVDVVESMAKTDGLCFFPPLCVSLLHWIGIGWSVRVKPPGQAQAGQAGGGAVVVAATGSVGADFERVDRMQLRSSRGEGGDRRNRINWASLGRWRGGQSGEGVRRLSAAVTD